MPQTQSSGDYGEAQLVKAKEQKDEASFFSSFHALLFIFSKNGVDFAEKLRHILLRNLGVRRPNDDAICTAPPPHN